MDIIGQLKLGSHGINSYITTEISDTGERFIKIRNIPIGSIFYIPIVTKIETNRSVFVSIDYDHSRYKKLPTSLIMVTEVLEYKLSADYAIITQLDFRYRVLDNTVDSVTEPKEIQLPVMQIFRHKTILLKLIGLSDNTLEPGDIKNMLDKNGFMSPVVYNGQIFYSIDDFSVWRINMPIGRYGYITYCIISAYTSKVPYNNEHAEEAIEILSKMLSRSTGYDSI